MEEKKLSIDTQLIHAGVEPDPSTGAIMTPIYQTSTFVQSTPGHHKGYEYARSQNPTRQALEKALAIIENGKYASCYSSGMAATDAILKLLKPGDEVLSTNDLYGGSYRIFTKIFENFGIHFNFVDMIDASKIEASVSEKTKMLWVETPTNPMLNIIDIEACASIAKKHDLLLVVDNTFASPYLQNPLDWGANIVMHSATKYLGGHSDVVHGCVITNNDEIHQKLKFIQNSCGAIPGPQDCFLVLRGLKTLHVRMRQHSLNGKAVAEWLRQHDKVEKVFWCGFEDHPNHKIAEKQMRDFGGMLSFTLKEDTTEAAHKIMGKTKLFALAESLGGVESLIGHPATMTHASIPRKERISNGLKDSMIRLSVGIEDVNDLIDDLETALN